MRVAVAGLGYWGPNLARNVDALAGAELAWGCDERPEARERFAAQHPRARIGADIDELLADPELDAVMLATPVPTHGATGRARPATRASTASSRSRSPSRWPTPSVPLPPRAGPGAC